MITTDQAEKMLQEEGFRTIYEWQDGPNAMYPPHEHPTLSAHIILTGSLTLITEGKVEELQAGDRFDIPANISHEVHVGPYGCRYLVGEK